MQLRNRSIKTRDFKSGGSAARRFTANLGLKNRGRQTTDVSVRRMTSEDDDNVQALDQSYDMMSVGGSSMAGMSDASGGSGVERIGQTADDDFDGSMYEGASDVQVVKQDNDLTFDDVNTSMAGLSDASIGDIQQLGNLDDSQADYANTSMASLGDINEVQEKETPSDNMFDSLKLNVPAQNLNDSKLEAIKDSYRKTQIFDEADEDDYDEEDDEDDGGERKSITRKSGGSKRPKLTDLITPKRDSNKNDESLKSIEERKSTLEDSPYNKHLTSTSDTHNSLSKM